MTNHVSQRGDYEKSLEYLRVAIQNGSVPAYLNAAHAYELQGSTHDSRSTYQVILHKLKASSLPTFHIELRLATLLPVILSGFVFRFNMSIVFIMCS